MFIGQCLNIKQEILIPTLILGKPLFHELLGLKYELLSPLAIVLETLGDIQLFDLKAGIFKIENGIFQPFKRGLLLSLLILILALLDEVARETEDTKAYFGQLTFSYRALRPALPRSRRKLIIVSKMYPFRE